MVRRRVEHLKGFAGKGSGEKEGEGLLPHEESEVLSASWKKCRLNRMLVDHLLREGMYDTAALLADTLNIAQLTNVEVSRVRE
jgi:hypothetical protein